MRPVPRFIDNNLVEDVIIIEREVGSTVRITFVTVVDNASDSYRWIIDGIYNPSSTQQSDFFTGLTVYNLNGFQILRYIVIGGGSGPFIQNT